MSILEELVKLANHLDEQGKYKIASTLDKIVKKAIGLEMTQRLEYQDLAEDEEVKKEDEEAIKKEKERIEKIEADKDKHARRNAVVVVNEYMAKIFEIYGTEDLNGADMAVDNAMFRISDANIDRESGRYEQDRAFKDTIFKFICPTIHFKDYEWQMDPRPARIAAVERSLKTLKDKIGVIKEQEMKRDSARKEAYVFNSVKDIMWFARIYGSLYSAVERAGEKNPKLILEFMEKEPQKLGNNMLDIILNMARSIEDKELKKKIYDAAISSKFISHWQITPMVARDPDINIDTLRKILFHPRTSASVANDIISKNKEFQNEAAIDKVFKNNGEDIEALELLLKNIDNLFPSLKRKMQKKIDARIGRLRSMKENGEYKIIDGAVDLAKWLLGAKHLRGFEEDALFRIDLLNAMEQVIIEYDKIQTEGGYEEAKRLTRKYIGKMIDMENRHARRREGYVQPDMNEIVEILRTPGQ